MPKGRPKGKKDSSPRWRGFGIDSPRFGELDEERYLSRTRRRYK